MNEKQLIARLKRLAKDWPEGYWLYSASGSLHLMKNGADGQPVMTKGDGFDHEARVATIDIPNDGGDW